MANARKPAQSPEPAPADAVLWARLQRALAHELRTPLHAMTGWLHLLEARVDEHDPMQARAIEGLRRSIVQQAELADLLTATAASQAGEPLSAPEQVDRLAVWHDVLAAHVDWAPGSARRMRTQAAPAARVGGDAQALALAFDALLRQLARDAGPAAAIDVRFEARGEALALRVDGTPGVALLSLEGDRRELPPKTFIERFRARQVLAEHRIELHAAAVPAGPSAETADGAVAGDAVSAGRVEPVPGRHVLVVDDQPELREVLSALIEQRGDHATTAASAADAMARIEACESFDIAILDIAMPGEDGISLIERIRARESDARLPAIALTAHANARLRREALDAGFDVFLAKPVDPVLLFETIDRLALGAAGR